MEWQHKNFSTKKKFKVQPPAERITCSIFFSLGGGGQERGCRGGFPLTHDQFCSIFGYIEETEDTNYKSEA
jgi:hypothetical protein